MENYKKVIEELKKIYKKKNHDYGNSFHKIYKRFGLLSSIIRLSDKLERLETLLTKPSKVDESIRDTLLDLANYSILTIIEIDKEKKNNDTNK